MPSFRRELLSQYGYLIFDHAELIAEGFEGTWDKGYYIWKGDEPKGPFATYTDAENHAEERL